MKYLVMLMIVCVGGCDSAISDKLSKNDIEMARCICKKLQKELWVVEREGDRIHFKCDDGQQLSHTDKSYTEGCNR